MNEAKNFYVKTFGCTVNNYDTEIIRGLLEKNRYKSSDIENADYLIINTCGVKQVTENRVIHVLKNMSNLNKKLIIAGCLPKINLKRIKKEVPAFAAIMDPQSVHKIVEIINKIENGQDKLIVFSEKSPIKPTLYKSRLNPVIGTIQISEGCNLACSYCCTRFARGNLQCYPPKHIVKEAECLVKNGCKELYITSQDNASYNFDGVALPRLLNEICKLNGKFFVRVGMMNPLHVKNILDELIEAFQNEKVFKFAHIPLQSGSDKILGLMKRGYKARDFLKLVKKFRENIPSLTISTDIIVGFPGESKRDFKLTIKLLEKIKPDIVNVSKFGARPKTEAAKMKQLERKTINERSFILSNLVKEISLENNRKWIGWKGEILIDEKGKNDTFIGRNFAYKPIVVEGKNLLGRFVDVEIFEASSNCLFGKLR